MYREANLVDIFLPNRHIFTARVGYILNSGSNSGKKNGFPSFITEESAIRDMEMSDIGASPFLGFLSDL
jgi:hypothetical protein